LNRRGFLRAGRRHRHGAAAAVVLRRPAAVAAESDADKKKARYKESDHVKTYYRVNRY
jgi:hypothetical protein